MATIKDVASVAGVGTSTVSRYLNNSGYVSDAQKKNIQIAIEKLNYKPNYSAKTLKSQRSNMIALFVPTINHPFFCKIAYYVEHYLYEQKYGTIIVSSQDNKQKEIELLQMLSNQQIDGAIFITHHDYANMQKDLPVVTIDRHLSEDIPCITSDNRLSSIEAVKFLIKKGCKKIGLLGGQPRTESEVLQRYFAYLSVMSELNMPTFIEYSDIIHGEEKEVAKRFLDNNPSVDGVFVTSDTLANALYQALIDRGRKVPQDVKIIAYDGILMDWIKHPNMTCIKQDLDGMAKEAVKQLMHRIKKEPTEKKVYVPCTFVEGETT